MPGCERYAGGLSKAPEELELFLKTIIYLANLQVASDEAAVLRGFCLQMIRE